MRCLTPADILLRTRVEFFCLGFSFGAVFALLILYWGTP